MQESISDFFGSCESVSLARSSKSRVSFSTASHASYSRIDLPTSCSSNSEFENAESNQLNNSHHETIKNDDDILSKTEEIVRFRKHLASRKSLMQSLRDAVFNPNNPVHQNGFKDKIRNPNDEAFQLFSTKLFEIPCSKENGLTIFTFLGFMRSFIGGLILMVGYKYSEIHKVDNKFLVLFMLLHIILCYFCACYQSLVESTIRFVL